MSIWWRGDRKGNPAVYSAYMPLWPLMVIIVLLAGLVATLLK
jgi:hypothetical protein